MKDASGFLWEWHEADLSGNRGWELYENGRLVAHITERKDSHGGNFSAIIDHPLVAFQQDVWPRPYMRLATAKQEVMDYLRVYVIGLRMPGSELAASAL